ncbi:hypothetical protein OAF97_02540, partial [Akkermansiaceae bacterium]|nr:hypothetical protein [Akkermansiaceae bacterium]
GQSNPDQKRKGRLDKVMQRATRPRNMTLMKGQGLPQRTFRKTTGYLRQVQDLGHHQEHHQPSKNIDGPNAFLRRGKW